MNNEEENKSHVQQIYDAVVAAVEGTLKKFSETQERSVSCIDSGNGYLVKRQPRTLCEIM